jgi:hypothetical protein
VACWSRIFDLVDLRAYKTLKKTIYFQVFQSVS